MTFLHLRDELRESTPLVQCLTNSVAMPLSANVLLAAGASPAMIDTPEESADFAAAASGVLINVGTPTSERYAAMRESSAATAAGTVGHRPRRGRCAVHRTDFVRSLFDARPTAPAATPEVSLGGGGSGGPAWTRRHNEQARPAARARRAHRRGRRRLGPEDLIIPAARDMAEPGIPCSPW